MNFSASLLAKLSALGAGLLPPAIIASPFYSKPSWDASQLLPSPPSLPSLPLPASPNNRVHSGVASAKRKARKAKRQRQAKRMQARSTRNA